VGLSRARGGLPGRALCARWGMRSLACLHALYAKSWALTSMCMLLNSQATPRARKLRLGRSGCSRGWARRFEEQVQAAGEALRHAEDELMQNLGAQQKAIAYDAKWRERASSAMQR